MKKLEKSALFLFSFAFLTSLPFSNVSAAKEPKNGDIVYTSSCSTPSVSNTKDSGYPTFSNSRYTYKVYSVREVEKNGKKEKETSLSSNFSAACNIKSPTSESDKKFSEGYIKYSSYGYFDGAADFNGNKVGDSSKKTGYTYFPISVDTSFAFKGSNYGKNSINGTSSTNNKVAAVSSNRTNLKTTYDYEDMPDLNCKVTYGDNSTTNCSPIKIYDAPVNTNDNNTTRLMCFGYYASTKDGDSACYKRIYPKEMDVLITSSSSDSNPDKVYPGFQFKFSCDIVYADGTVRSTDSLNLSDAQYRKMFELQNPSNGIHYIGEKAFSSATAYKLPDGSVYTPKKGNYFLSSDSNDREYTVKCTIPTGINGNRTSNSLFNDSDKPSGSNEPYAKVVSGTKKFKNIGVKDLSLEVEGYFGDYNQSNASYSLKKKTIKENGNSFEGDPYLIAGHFYKYRAIAEFTDNNKIDVSKNPFIEWETDVAYKGSTLYSPPKAYYSTFPKNGTIHRTPFNLGTNNPGKIKIRANFLNNSSAAGTKKNDKTYTTVYAKTREVIKTEIRKLNANGTTSAVPLTNGFYKLNSNQLASQNFAFVVTYDNGDVENWSNTKYTSDSGIVDSVKWSETASSGSNPTQGRNFNFTNFKGKDRQVTIFAKYFNHNHLSFNYSSGVSDDPGSFMEKAVKTVSTTTKSYNKDEGVHFEAYYAHLNILLDNCTDLTDSKLGLGCTNNPEQIVKIASGTAKKFKKADVPPTIQAKFQTPTPYKFTFSTANNSGALLPDQFVGNKAIEKANEKKKNETNLFYDIRYFPVSGMSGSSGRN